MAQVLLQIALSGVDLVWRLGYNWSMNDYEKLVKKLNVRDFGGIKAEGGKSIKNGLFVRSCGLHKFSKKDVETIRNLGVRTVIDLRTVQEIAEKPDPILSGVRYLNMPIYDASVFGITHEKRYKITTIKIPDMPWLYQKMVKDEFSVCALRAIFQEVCALPKNGAVLWHCSEGKDRCGLVSALFLALLGVNEETIFSDYLYTNRYNLIKSKIFWALALVYRRSLRFAESARLSLVADRTYLESAFNYIKSTYGSLDNFFRTALGITDSQKSALRAYCLE